GGRLDFLERLKGSLESLDYTPDRINIGLHDKNRNSIAIRPSPSNISDRQMDTGKIYNFSFQLLIHNENNLVGYKTANRLTEFLDDVNKSNIISNDNSFSLVFIECTTLPNFVEETSFGALWTAIYNAELYIQGGK